MTQPRLTNENAGRAPGRASSHRPEGGLYGKPSRRRTRSIAAIVAGLAAATLPASPASAAPGDITTASVGLPGSPAGYEGPQAATGRVLNGTAYLYVADRGNNRVKVVVAPDGVVDGSSGESVTTVAGGGDIRNDIPEEIVTDIDTGDEDVDDAVDTVPGAVDSRYLGDGGPATKAKLAYPNAVAVDDAGNLFIGDQGNHRVRVVLPGVDGVVDGDLDETIATVAGNGNPRSTLPPNNPLTPWVEGVPAVLAPLNFPTGVAVSGTLGGLDFRLYVADLGNEVVNAVRKGQVRKVDRLGLITTVPGVGLDAPIGVTLADDANAGTDTRLFVTGQADDKVRLVNVGSANVSANGVTVTPGTAATVAGTGAAGFSGDGAGATSAQLNNPFSTAVDSAGNLYIADENNHRVRIVNSAGTISTKAGTGTAGFSGDGGAASSAQLDHPRGVAVSGSNLYIGDTDNDRIRRVEL